jgi:hypothetical protein
MAEGKAKGRPRNALEGHCHGTPRTCFAFTGQGFNPLGPGRIPSSPRRRDEQFLRIIRRSKAIGSAREVALGKRGRRHVAGMTRSSMKRARATLEARKSRVNCGSMSERWRHPSSGAASLRPISSSSTCGGGSIWTCTAATRPPAPLYCPARRRVDRQRSRSFGRPHWGLEPPDAAVGKAMSPG